VQDGKDSDQAVTPAEGVRIIGAEEAQAALAADSEERTATRARATVDLPDAERAERDERVDDAPNLLDRDVAYPDAGPTWSAAEAGDAPVLGPSADAASGEVPPLPHWTEPPTGAVPAIFADDTGENADVDEDLDAWAAIGGGQARFRAEDADWAEADAFAFGGEEEKLGALDEAGPVDEEAAFAEELAARRRRPTVARARTRPHARTPAPDTETPTGPSSGRDVPTAIMTGLAVAVLAFVSFQYTWWTALFAAVIMGVATVELCNTLQTKGMRPATLLALTGSFALPLAAKEYGTGAYPAFFALMVVFSMLWFLWQVTPGRPLLGVATTVLAFAYVGGLGGFAGLSLASPDGVGIIIGLAICTVAYDVVGFFVGSQFGRSRVAPNVSPNKTVAGTVAGMAASVFFGTVVSGFIAPWDHGKGFVLGVLVAGAAFLGDLCASLIKRDLGVKDFGSLLPGHGGVLDRFDGLLFCLPIAYYLALHWNFF
jgi:phosphatidate cytidylyltransferase